MTCLGEAPSHIPRQLQDYSYCNDIIFFKNVILVSDDEELRRQILRSRHDAPVARYLECSKTVDLVSRTLYWPSLTRYARRYVDSCDTCQPSKSTRHARYGLLQPIPAADAPWEKATTDFIVISVGFDSIMVVVDKNTKLAHFIPTTEATDSASVVAIYLQYVWKLDGTSTKLFLVRKPVFVSKFMRRLHELLRIQPTPTTAFHLSRTGRTERGNHFLEQILRMFTTKR